MKHLRTIAVVAAIALLGAGCSQSAQVNVNTNDQPSAASENTAPQANGASGTLDVAAWENEDINADIKAAQQMDAQQMQSDKQASDAEIKEQQKSAIETQESEGVTFE